MATMFNGTDLIQEFCNIFQIESMHIRSMRIEIEIDDVVRIEVTHFMDVEQRERLVSALKHYKLTPIKEDAKDKNK